MSRDRSRSLEWGRGRRPIVKNTVGAPNPKEGSDGDVQIRNTNLGAKMFGKLGGKWYDAPLSIDGTMRIGTNLSNHLSIDNDTVDIITNGTKVATFGATTIVKDIHVTGNIVVGKEDGTFNIDDNIYIGNDQSTSGGLQNVAIGYQAGQAISGIDNLNVFIGYNAGKLSHDTGNVCIGGVAGNALTSGNNNVMIGNGSDGDPTSNTQVAVGHNTITSGLAGIALGSNVTAATKTFVFGKSSEYATSTTFTNSGSCSFTFASDERRKRNIQDSNIGLELINKLKTRTFQWKPSKEFPEEWEPWNLDKNGNKVYDDIDTNKVMHGFIAQEVKDVLDEYDVTNDIDVWKKDSKGIQMVNENKLIIPLIKAVQELSAEIEELKQQINS